MYTSQDYSEHFLDRMVPETLVSYEVSMAALVVHSSLTPRDGGGAMGEPQEVILLNILGMSDEVSRELALAGSLERTPDLAPRVGSFAPVDDGVLAPAFAEALYGGVGLKQDRPQ